MTFKKKFRAAAIKSGYSSNFQEENKEKEREEEEEDKKELKHKVRKEKKNYNEDDEIELQENQQQQQEKQEKQVQIETKILRSHKKDYHRNDMLIRSINMITPAEKKKNISKRKVMKICYLEKIPDALIIYIFSFFISSNDILIDDFLNIQAVDTRFQTLINSSAMWRNIPLTKLDGSLNLDAFSFKKLKNKGTEGSCFAARRRKDNQMVALKRARVYPNNEGVPYYMMRELSALKKLNHPNICRLEFVNLHDFKLYLLYPYVELTLHDILNPYPPPLNKIKNVIIKKDQVLNIMGQLISAVAYCHSKGILHRNLKPKHLLVIPGNNPLEPLESAQIQLADFALVRTLSTPSKKFTSEVITLWYRPPEILMGQRNYNAAVDIWSIGCIFAELLQGKAIFEGLCEIDQLFQIFRILGTPTDDDWSGFSDLPNFQDPIFPNWTVNRLWSKVNNATQLEFDLLNKCFQYDPDKRSSAEELLSHSYFYHTKYHQIKHDDRSLNEIGLVNLQKTTIPQYKFLKSFEDDLSVLKYAQLSNNDICTFTTDTSKIGIYSNEELELREETVQWILSIAGRDESSLSTRTGYFAVALFDAFFHTPIENLTSTSTTSTSSSSTPQSITKIERTLSHQKQPITYANSKWSCENHSILVGACCLHIASKCEDVSYAGIRDISFSLNEEYDVNLFLVMEEQVLNTLQFNFYLPTVIDFLGIFIYVIPEMIQTSPSQKSLCMYLGELSLYYALVCQYKPSLIATAIVSYSLTFTSDGGYNSTPNVEWPQSLQILSNYSFQEDILPCINKLRDCMRIAYRNLSTPSSYSHYTRSSNHGVSRWIPHEIKSFSL